jgi:predicted Zn-dependent protease
MFTARIRSLVLVGFAALLVAPLGACKVNPATGKRSLILMTWEQEKQLGLEAAPQMTDQFGGEVPDATATDYTREVGMKLTTGVEEAVPDLDWEFTLVNSPVINAFALPGGKIFMTRGLAEKLSSEAEFAGVLGHEIGHVTARHSNQQMSAQLGLNFALGAAAVAVGVSDPDSDVRRYGQAGIPAIAVGSNLFLLKYGRDDESEADLLGMRYMSRAGYDPVGQLRVMQVLQQASEGSGRPPEFLSTHPYPESRIERIKELLNGDFSGTQNNPDYVIRAEDYQRRMLTPLSRLAPAPDPSSTEESAMLLNTWMWCAHCRESEGT